MNETIEFPPPSERQTFAFEFRGGVAEYFKIWLVNVLLSIIAVGLYSPWATVRTRRYFHGCTVLAGANFDYHARASSILVARLILVAFIVGGSIIAGDDALRAGIHSSLIFVLLPWTMARGFAFNARNISYRGIRFDFARRYRRLYLIFLPGVLLVVVFNALIAASELPIYDEDINRWAGATVLFALIAWFVSAPFVARAYHRYKAKHHRIGRIAFDFHPPRLRAYFGALWLIPLCAAALAAAGWRFLNTDWQRAMLSADDALTVYLFSLALVVVAAYLLLTSFLFKFYWRGVATAQARIVCRISAWRFALWIRLVNLIAAVLTLGLAIPWARIRRARYLAANMALEVDAQLLDALTAAGAQAGSAFGAEFAGSEGFEFDVGLV